MTKFGQRRGAAIIFVLGLIFAAAAVGLVLTEYASYELRPRASAMYERSLREDAYSALNATIAVIEEYDEIDGGIYSDLQGWGKPFEDGRIKLADGSDVSVTVTDEGGKISLRTLSSDQIQKILEYLGLSERDADTVADSIIDWCDSDSAESLNGAEKDSYNKGEAIPPNRNMRSFAELRLIKNAKDFFFDADGKPTELYERFTKIVTLENATERNLNGASEDTLGAMMYMEDKEPDPNIYKAVRGEIGSIDDGIVWIKSPTEIANRGAPEYPVQKTRCTSQLLKIEISVKRGAGTYYLCAFYGLTGLLSDTSSGSSSNSASSGSSSSGGGRGGSSSGSSSSGGASRAAGSSSSSSTSTQGLIGASAYNSKSSSAKKKGTMKILRVYERGM